MTWLYFGMAALLVAAAFRRNRDWCAGIMAMGLVASIAAYIAGVLTLHFIAAVDGISCGALAAVWTVQTSMRAWSIGIIGLGKTGATVAAYVIDAYTINLTFALFINAAFLAQVVIAGGWADEVGIRLDNLFARLAPRRHGLLRDGAR